MLIDHYRNIIDDLALNQSVFLPHLTRAWSLDERGRAFVFAPGVVQSIRAADARTRRSFSVRDD
jgi:hypothetical protein